MTDPRGDAVRIVEQVRGEAVAIATETRAVVAEVRQLQKYGRRNRFWLKVAGWSIAFDVVLSVALGYVGFKAYDAAEGAASAKRAAFERCVTSNGESAKQRDLWNYFFLSAAPAATPEEQAARDAAEAKIAATFAPQDCGPPP